MRPTLILPKETVVAPVVNRPRPENGDAMGVSDAMTFDITRAESAAGDDHE